MTRARSELNERKLKYLTGKQRSLTEDQREAMQHYLLAIMAERVTLADWEHSVDVATRAVKRKHPTPIGAAT